jgi:penicillin-binding protein
MVIHVLLKLREGFEKKEKVGESTMKKLVVMAVMLFIITGCNKEKVNPYDVLDEYITTWEEQNFSNMYENFLTSDSKAEVPSTLFEEKYQEVYELFEMDNLQVEVLDREQQWEEETTITIPGKISYDTFARKIDYEVNFVMEKVLDEEENENWYVKWDSSFIFPEYELTDTFHIETTKAVRGEILDSKGNKLAANEEVLELGIVPGKFDEERDLNKLAEIIDMSPDDIKALYSVSWAAPDYLMPIKKFREADIEIVREAIEMEGVTNTRPKERVYPYGVAAAHLIGYIGNITAEEIEKYEGYSQTDRIGKTGLEAVYEDRLKGKNGIEVIQTIEGGKEKTIARTEPVRGEDIKLTIDADMQKTLYETMREDIGKAAVVDPESGNVLSLVSVPSYDPNGYTLGMSEAQKKLLENPNQPTLNRFRSTYSPGSTMKLLTAIVGLESGKIDPNKKYEIPRGGGWQKDASWGAFKVTRVYEDDTQVDLKSGLNNSDNIYFAMAGLDIGAKEFEEGLKKLGIGEEMPFSYPPVRDSQISNTGVLDNEVLLADTAYGQGQILMNIIHLASIYGGVVNNGSMMKPLLLEEESAEVWKENIVSPENAKLLQDNLRRTVTEGKSRIADLPGREIAGKTGTAELKEEQGTAGMENGLWVSYDQKNPGFLTAMLIEDVLDKGGSRYTIELTNKFYKALSN